MTSIWTKPPQSKRQSHKVKMYRADFRKKFKKIWLGLCLKYNTKARMKGSIFSVYNTKCVNIINIQRVSTNQ